MNPNSKSSNNNLKSSLSHGDIVVGTFVMEFAVPQIATILASAGADFIIIDMEHTTFTMQTIGQIIRAARGSDLPSIVRVPSIERHFISRVLDAGASGLMIPRIESPNDVEKIIHFSKYSPEGDRGVAFGIGHTDYGDFRQLDEMEYLAKANEDLVIVGQIETKKGVGNIDKILSTGGLDAIFLGLYDLSTSLGVSGELNHQLVLDASNTVIKKAKKYGTAIGSYVNDFETGGHWIDRGVQMFACGNDAFLVTCKFAEVNQKFKKAL